MHLQITTGSSSRNPHRILCILCVLSTLQLLLPVSSPAESAPTYVDVTAEAGIDFIYVSGSVGEKYMPEAMGSGAAFVDVDADGWLDLYIVNGAPLPGFQVDIPPVNALYRNATDGTFLETTAAGVGDDGYGMGVATGDYDGDGDTDLYVTNVGANVLLRNSGKGVFTDATSRAGVGDEGWGTSAAFVDADRDGDLDLYVANYLVFSVEGHKRCMLGDIPVYCSPTTYPGQSGVMYENQGTGQFRNITRAAGLYTTRGRQLAAVFGDYDADGDQDLFIANDKTPNFLFRNGGDGTFDEVGLLSGISYDEKGVPESAMGADLADYDNDGRLDAVVATYQWAANTLYHNDGDGFFSDTTFPAGLGVASIPFLGMSASFLDYDNDGFLDVFATNGHIDVNVADFDPATTYLQRNQLFRNRRDGTFADVTSASGPGLAAIKVSHGAAFADYDNDGDMDIFVSDGNDEPSQLLRNDGGTHHWLCVRVIGAAHNLDGIGTRLTLEAGDLRLVREVRTSYGYMSSSDPRVLFGLGDRERVDRLHIRWPNGQLQRLEDMAADQFIILEQPP
jgi:enediyne biosynthesis protein E4